MIKPGDVFTILENNNTTHDAYRYKDDKSDKFWRVEYKDGIMAVNYGKTGTIGKYNVKYYDDEAEVKKLIASKVKKGYIPYPEFDKDSHFYFDDRSNFEILHHPLTSHPKYRAHFTHERYYCVADDFSPFGSDDGADTIMIIEEDIRRAGSKPFDFTAYPKKRVESDGSMTYYPANDLSKEAISNLLKNENGEMYMVYSDNVTYAIAFAQIKITGKIDAELKQMAINAMKRQIIADDMMEYYCGGEFGIIPLTQMIEDLESFEG